LSPVNLIVVADSDLLQDRFWVRVQNFLGTRVAIPDAANGNLVINALDHLAGSSDLISVRNRGSYTRPFSLVQSIRQEAEIRFRQKEQKLLLRLRETEDQLAEFEERRPEDEALLLSAEQRQAIAGFRDQKLLIRKELRQVRHALRNDIDRLGRWLKFFNIGLVPALIGISGVLVGVSAARRRRRTFQLHAQIH